MKRKKLSEINLDPKAVRIRITPAWGGDPVIGWIQHGSVVTYSGPVSYKCTVTLGPRCLDSQSDADYADAARVIKHGEFRRALYDYGNGTMTDIS